MASILSSIYLSGMWFVLGGLFFCFCFQKQIPGWKNVPAIVLFTIGSWVTVILYIVSAVNEWSL